MFVDPTSKVTSVPKESVDLYDAIPQFWASVLIHRVHVSTKFKDNKHIYRT